MVVKLLRLVRHVADEDGIHYLYSFKVLKERLFFSVIGLPDLLAPVAYQKPYSSFSSLLFSSLLFSSLLFFLPTSLDLTQLSKLLALSLPSSGRYIPWKWNLKTSNSCEPGAQPMVLDFLLRLKHIFQNKLDSLKSCISGLEPT